MKKLSSLSPKCIANKGSKISQNGVFAKENLKKGELIAVWGGYIYDLKEFRALPSPTDEYPVQVYDTHFIGPKPGDVLDPCEMFNHSCDANAGVKGQIILIARRDIKKGEEICFDYETTNITDLVFTCNCGSRICRKKITGNSWKNPSFQKKYKGYLSYYIEEKIKKLKKIR